MRRRIASTNDLPIKESERKYHWALGGRPGDYPSLVCNPLLRHSQFRCKPILLISFQSR